MVWAIRAHTAETLTQPSPDLRLRAPYFYPDGAADKAAIQLVKVQPCQLLGTDT
jgi:hypothetical protein